MLHDGLVAAPEQWNESRTERCHGPARCTLDASRANYKITNANIAAVQLTTAMLRANRIQANIFMAGSKGSRAYSIVRQWKGTKDGQQNIAVYTP